MASPFLFKLTNPFQLEMHPDPDSVSAPTAEQVCIKTVYSAISPGTEIAAYKGDSPLRPTTKIYPRLQGYCNVGRITTIGAKVDNWQVGDLVLTHSAHRSHDRIPLTDIICRIPKSADLPSASTTYLFHLAYNACLRTGMVAGNTVAVIGLGTLGLTSGSVARLFGAKVSGFSNNAKDKIDLIKFGFSNIYQKSADNHENKADIVITTSNHWDDWQLAMQLARPGGKIAVLGFPGRGQSNPSMNPLASEFFYDKQLSVISCGYSPNQDVPKQDVRFTLKRNCQYLLSEI